MRVFGAKRESSNVYFVYSLAKLGFCHYSRFAITGKQDVAANYFLLQGIRLIIFVIDGIAISVHLVDSIFRWNVHTVFVFPVNTIFRIKQVSHFHSFLQIVLGKLQHNVRLLGDSWHSPIFYTCR